MKTLIDRFTSKTDIRGDDECWEWMGTTSVDGYGKFCVDKEQLAHRVSWMIYVGKIPAGMLVCHKCDNPPCVNPSHLFLGTIKDNNLDRDRKGRTVVPSTVGSRHGMAKLTERDVKTILEMHRDGYANVEIKRAINKVGDGMLSLIVNRKNWKHVEI